MRHKKFLKYSLRDKARCLPGFAGRGKIKQGGRTQPNGAGQRVVRRSIDEERRGTKKGHRRTSVPLYFVAGPRLELGTS